MYFEPIRCISKNNAKKFSLSTIVLALLSTASLVAGAAVSNASTPNISSVATITQVESSSYSPAIDALAKLGTSTNPLSADSATAAAVPIDVLFVCDPANFAQPCYFLGIEFVDGTCYDVPFPLYRAISSMQGLYTNVKCWFYLGDRCNGESRFIDSTSLGYFNYIPVFVPAFFDNAISSIRCYVQ